MDSKSIFQNFIRTLAVMNGAIELYHDSPRFWNLHFRHRSTLVDTDVEVAVYTDDPEQPDDFFTITVRNGKFVLAEHGVEHADPDWIVSGEYLCDVAHHPGRYLNYPSKLDFDWLDRHIEASAD